MPRGFGPLCAPLVLHCPTQGSTRGGGSWGPPCARDRRDPAPRQRPGPVQHGAHRIALSRTSRCSNQNYLPNGEVTRFKKISFKCFGTMHDPKNCRTFKKCIRLVKFPRFCFCFLSNFQLRNWKLEIKRSRILLAATDPHSGAQVNTIPCPDLFLPWLSPTSTSECPGQKKARYRPASSIFHQRPQFSYSCNIVFAAQCVYLENIEGVIDLTLQIKLDRAG